MVLWLQDWLLGFVAVVSTLAGPADEPPECLILGGLDSVRVRAFASARPDLLETVYATSGAATKDRNMLATFTDRGLRLSGGALQRLRCELIRRQSDRIELKVTDRLGPTWVVDDTGRRRELPRATSVARRIELVRTGDGWRVGSAARLSIG